MKYGNLARFIKRKVIFGKWLCFKIYLPEEKNQDKDSSFYSNRVTIIVMDLVTNNPKKVVSWCTDLFEVPCSTGLLLPRWWSYEHKHDFIAGSFKFQQFYIAGRCKRKGSQVIMNPWCRVAKLPKVKLMTHDRISRVNENRHTWVSVCISLTVKESTTWAQQKPVLQPWAPWHRNWKWTLWKVVSSLFKSLGETPLKI